jgi:glutathionyl-hydroquinone reductase
MYNKPEFKKWTNFHQIKAGYAGVSRRANDKEVIVPAGPSVEDVL